jgi:aryl-alcohol dehydrogenase-like predicted oxidoreductase
VEASLERLGTAYIDLYQCHRFDPQVPIEEVCFAMHNLIDGGYVHYWGVSQWTAVQLTNALRICERNGWQKPISNQPIYNMLNRSLEVDVLEVCAAEQVGLLVYSPLAQGILTGKYKPGHIPADSRAGNPETAQWFSHKRLNDTTFAQLARLETLAGKLRCSLAQLALAWCLRVQPVTTVILGASRPEQVTENLGALQVLLSVEIQAEIEAILQNAPVDQYTGSRIGWQA